ncbi:MAG: DNA replication and repair protein RecF, partial [Alistipes sp.]|nr:DNA replication and repair protein RecF [Alistipes sp.]
PYLTALIRYNALLTERNRLLKMQPDEVMLSIYDAQLAEQGEKIHARRAEVVTALHPLVADYYRILSEDREQVELDYKSELNERSMAEVLQAARQKDLVNEFTTAGIHRDDLTFKIGGYPLRKYGSQGQQKSFLIALKLAQYRLLAQATGERPILLLDDLFDKLDAGRVEQLIRLVSETQFGQIIITDCNPTRLESILNRAQTVYTLYRVSEGATVRQPNTEE